MALPETHWFRQLETKSWVRIINLTPRADNYLLLQQVSNKNLLHFSEDVDVLWFIHKLFEEGDEGRALQWFDLIKSDVNYRSQNNTTLNEVAKNLNDKSLLTPYEFVYICKASAPRGLSVLSAFFNADLMPTLELRNQIWNTQTQIKTERLKPQRSNNFASLIDAFADLLTQTGENEPDHPQRFETYWTKEMKRRHKLSGFDRVLPEDAFVNFLLQFETKSMLYPTDSKHVIADFLNRFTTKIGDGLQNVVPFQSETQELKYDKDIFQPTMRLLSAMRSYRDDGDEKTQLAYAYFNQHWDERSAQTTYNSFADSVQSLGLSNTVKSAVYLLISAIDKGLIPFMENAAHDLLASPDGLPEELPSVKLYKQNETNNQLPNPHLQSMSRKLLYTTQEQSPYTFSNTPFLRTSRYIILPISLVSFFIITAEGNQHYANLVTVTQPLNALPYDDDNQETQDFDIQIYRRPVEETNVGLALSNLTWTESLMRLSVYTGLVSIASVLHPNGPSSKIVSFLGALGTVGIELGTTAVASLKSLTFNQAVAATSAATVAFYGPEAVGQAAQNIGSGLGFAGLGLLAAGVGFVLLSNPSMFKKRKLK